MNAVSVIGVALEGSNNISNRSNSPVNENESENQRSIAATNNNEVAQITALHLYATENEKQSRYGQFSRDCTALSDKIEFKQKMKRILCCRICSELRRCPIFQVIFFLVIHGKEKAIKSVF